MDEVAVTPTATSSTADSIMHESGSIFNRITADMVEILIYMVCLTIGGPLNLYSFYRLIQTYRRRVTSQINLLRINLNIADLLTLFVFVLSQIIWMTTYQWLWGDLLCRILKFFHTFSFYLNSFVVACIAIDRVFGTCNLSSVKASQQAQRRCRRMLSVAWICAFTFSLPQVFIFRVFYPSEMRNFKQCTPIWTIVAYEVDLALKKGNMSYLEEKNLFADYYQMVRLEKIYGILHLLFMFWIPATIIVFSYAAIICILSSMAQAPSRIQSADKRSWKSYIASCFGLLGLLPAKDSSSRFSFHEKGSIGPQSQMAPFPTERLLSLSESQGENFQLNSEIRQPSLTSEPGRPRLPSDKENDESYPNSRGTSLKRSGNSARVKMGPLALQTIARARQAAKRQGALILLAYLTLWTPYNLLAVVNAFASEVESRQFASVTLTFLNSLLVVNSCINPLIYAMKP